MKLFIAQAMVVGLAVGLLLVLLWPAVQHPPINSREDCETVYERPCRIKWEPVQ